MKYINKLNIDFDQWDKIRDDLFDEEYVLSKLNDEDKNKYFLLKKFLLKNNIFNKFFINFFDNKSSFIWDISFNNEYKIIEFIHNTYINSLISLSFNWYKSNENFDFWINILNKWVYFLKNGN